MMQRSKSFSKGGNIIDRVIEIERYRVDPQTLKKMLAPKLCNEIRTHKQDQSEHPEELAPTPFDKLTGRNKPNSFLRFNVKDANTHLNYSPDKDKVMTKAAVLPVRRQKEERLGELFAKAKLQHSEQQERSARKSASCKKYSAEPNQLIKTRRDLSARKTFHNIDFQKQTQRPFEKTLRKLSSQPSLHAQTLDSRHTQTAAHPKPDFLDKTAKVHSFASYTSRDFLCEKKVKGAPEASGLDWFRINPQVFKGNWKTVAGNRFEQGGVVRLSKLDRDCPHWFTQLSYNVKGSDGGKGGQVIFSAQTSRKDNVVKSAYPIRLAI